MRAPLLLVFLFAGLGLASCDEDKPKDSKSHDHHAAMEQVAKANPGPLVDVPKEGKKFEPPISPARLPDGVWYCDMGTVEYARAERGDGRCPICRMRLKQNLADKK